ncbi:disintegrin and metalloproteinase with thrombospondin motifs [Trebouxia sp. C0009 RCD-2024]
MPSTPVPASPETSPSVSPHASPRAGTPPDLEADITPASPYPLPSTPSTALPPVSGPTLAPAMAPEACPAPTCLRSQYQCGPMSQYHLSLALHTAIDEATSCTPDLDPDFCIVDEYIVELPVWDAVKASNCSYRCLDGSSLTCPANTSPPTPTASPASPPVATATPRASPVAVPMLTPTLTPASTPTPLANAKWAAPTPAEPSLAALAPFVLKYGPYGDCSVQCGEGNVTRALTCVSQAYGLPVELSNCPTTASTMANLTKPCSAAACGQYSFVTSPWGACSALCGSDGTASRNVSCQHNGVPVDPASDEYTQNCLPLAEPFSVQPCFATPCEPYMWRTGPWSNCTGGMQNRTVSCQRVRGGSADASVCTAELGYTAQSSRLCNTFTCNSTADCSNSGVCNAATSACTCQPGFTGPDCAISTGLCNSTAGLSNSSAAAGNSSEICCSTGAVDSAGGCCDSGVVSEAGSCCATNPAANVTLDRAGQCCSEGLDACGVCGGDGLTLDFTGVCCNGAIDASGLCCATPNVVDDFGVCGGNSSTGVIVLDMDVLSSSVAGLADANSSGHDAFASGYEALLASVLSIPASQAELQSLQTGTAPPSAPARRRLLTSQGFTSRSLLAAAPYTVSTTASVTPPYAELTYPKVQALIQSAYSNSTNAAGLAVKSLRSISKQGVAGNGLCEAGEMPSAAENFTGVPADCPIKFHPIPAGTGAAPCSGHGAPVAAQGTCQCYVGYDGPVCDACADGYQRLSGVCQRTLTSFKAQAAIAALAQSTTSNQKTSGASIGMIAGAVIAGVAAMLVALALFTTYRRRRSHNKHVYIGSKGAAGRTSGAFTAASSQGSQSSSGLSGGMAWAFQDPEHGSTTSKVSGAPTTTFVNPEYQPVTNRSHVMAREAESSLSSQQRSNFKMVLVNNKPMHSWYNWLTAAGISEDQVEVRKLGEGERDTERGPASPLPAKKPSLLKRAYDLTMGNTADSTVSSANSSARGFLGSSLVESDTRKRRAGAATAFSVMEPQYADMDRQAADKKARRGSLAFSNSSEAATDSSSGVTAGRGMYGLTMGEGGSDGIGRGGQSARRGGMTMFEAAPEDARKAAKSNIYGTMAFSDVEKENEGGLMKRISKGWKRGGSSQGSQGSTISSSGADSRGSARSGGVGSIAFTGSSGGRSSRHRNLLMETNMAFEQGSDAGGRTKRSHGTGFFAFSQAAEEEEERRNNRPNFAMSEDMTVPRGAPSAAPGGAKRVPLKELSRAESILSTQSTRRNYAYSLETAPDAHPTRKHLNTFSAVDATDDSEEAGHVHVKNPSQASLATSATGSDQSAAQLLQH